MRARGWLAPFPWREAAHLAFGLVSGVLLLATLAVAVALSPLVVFAAPVPLVALAAFARMGRFEARRFETVLGEAVDVRPVTPGTGRDARARWQALLAQPPLRSLAGYTLVRAPLALLEVGLLSAVFTWPLVMLAAAVRGLVGGGWPATGPLAGGSPAMAVLGVGVAVALVGVVTLIAPLLVRQLTRLDVAVTRALLGSREADLEQRVGELVEARGRVRDAAEAERVRIERDLHDGAQQRLIALGVSLGRAEERLRRDNPASETLGLVQAAKAETLGVVADIRALTRGLRPQVLESRGLDAALSAVASGLHLPVQITVEGDRLDPAIEAALYFALTECMTNVAKHAAGAPASVRVNREGGVVRAVVRDQGGAGPAWRRGRDCAASPTGSPGWTDGSGSPARRVAPRS
jgi:signal transduction histidine kinase